MVAHRAQFDQDASSSGTVSSMVRLNQGARSAGTVPRVSLPRRHQANGHVGPGIAA